MNIFLEAAKNKSKGKSKKRNKYTTGALDNLKNVERYERDYNESKYDELKDQIHKDLSGGPTKSASLKTHLKQGAFAGGTVLAGYAALKIKEMNCKKRCEEIKDPEKKGRCLEEC